MSRAPRDEAREERIRHEVIVDAHDEYEQASGWYAYLDDSLRFPFLARCVTETRISPLKVGETVNVIGLIEMEDEPGDILVEIEWLGRTLGVPLEHLLPVEAEAENHKEEVSPLRQAVEDWHYWKARGYMF